MNRLTALLQRLATADIPAAICIGTAVGTFVLLALRGGR